MKKWRGIVWRSSVMGFVDCFFCNCSVCMKIFLFGNFFFFVIVIILWIDFFIWIYVFGIMGLDRFNVVFGWYLYLVFCILLFRFCWVFGNRWCFVVLKCWIFDVLWYCDFFCRKVFMLDWFGMDFVRRDLFVGI